MSLLDAEGNAANVATQGLGPVRIVGTGLLGTSIGLGLRSLGVRVVLEDPSPTALALAADLGAGEPAAEVESEFVPALVIVAAPPDVTAPVVCAELERWPKATVTDVASVKSGVLAEVLERGLDPARYVGGHPMAGRERSGPIAARGDLFLGRPWVICPHAKNEEDRTDLVRRLALELGAAPSVMSAAEHDRAVALVSHVPQVAASLVAARLLGAAPEAVALAGQGLRDVTRIAASDPVLWAQILTANAGPVAALLRGVRTDLEAVIAALDALDAPEVPRGARATVARAIADGRAGRELIPGKHGGRAATYEVVRVLVPDAPGNLGRLFADVGAAQVNVEELALEHAPGREVGLVEISVLPAARSVLEAALSAQGWRTLA